MAKSTIETYARIPAWAKRTIPIIVSVLIIYYYFHKQDWQKLLAATTRANFTMAILAIVISQLVFWFFEVLLTERHIVWFHGPFPFKTFFWVRGAIYFLMMVNPSLGIGGVFVYLWRKARITWSKIWGIVLFRYGLLMWGICVLLIPTTFTMHYYGLSEKARINMWIWWGLLIFGFAWLFEAWFYWHHKKHFDISRVVARNPKNEFWTAFRIATRKQWWLSWAMEVPPFILFLIGIYFLSRAFEVQVPFLEFMVVSPLVIAVAEMPIAFAGFGTTTLAFVTFFGDYGSAKAIAVLTLFLPFARATLRVLIGLVSLRPALLDINTILKKPTIKTEQTNVTTIRGGKT